ncbi:MAG: ABC transporter ATP-binding protein [Elusimicrobia bacterium]|nr:ABC transporter ATP-binding protein [Elusimicrobiota bacterium]
MKDSLAPVLSVQGLRVHFDADDGVVRAVDGISYDLEAGRTLAVVGESGCGKSVHALSILGLLPRPPARIAGGAVLFQGRDLLDIDEEGLRSIRGKRIAMIFQEPMTALNPVLTIGEQIAEALLCHGKADRAEAKAAELLRRVGIPGPEERLRDYPHRFSGGMRQRAMIAMALACGPEVLIADEPTTALDVTIQAQILDLIRRLQEESGTAVVLITHNIGVVAEAAQDVAVMYAGRIVERAQVMELFREPLHPYTRGLLDSVPSLTKRKERLSAIDGQPPELLREPCGCPFADRCSRALPRCRADDPPEFLLPGGRMTNCWLASDAAVEVRHRLAGRPCLPAKDMKEAPYHPRAHDNA